MPIITISRGSRSGGRTFAERLGERLGYRVISREAIVEAAHELGVSEATLADAIQSPPGLWERLTHHKEDYILAVQAALAELVVEGHAIYHGNAGQLLLRGLAGVIRLRLIAPLETRIAAVRGEAGLGREEATRQIESADALRRKWVRQMYGVEWDDPSLYDLVVNLEHTTMDAAVELVAGLAARPEYAASPEQARELRDFVLATRVRAAVAFRSGFPERAVTVAVRDGVVELSGGPYFERHRAEVVKFVRSVAGVTTLASDGAAGSGGAGAADEPELTAGEVMVPLSGYPHLPEGASIREAMVALGASSVKLPDGHLVTPRYVLVLDRGGGLVGVVTRRDLLRGLAPLLRAAERAHELIGRAVPTADFSFPLGLRWGQLFGPGALVNAEEPVRTVMAPVRGSVKRSDDLSTVVSTMLEHGVDLVPVLEGPAIVGVVLMTELFDRVAERIVERGGQTKAAD